ncbi:hypothetical protein CXF72_04175 [Psychromonas sp. MB-3u-54]|nr:hypothetical protein CXF72_04175 [Psychromonas sp. MB-3u-54]
MILLASFFLQVNTANPLTRYPSHKKNSYSPPKKIFFTTNENMAQLLLILSFKFKNNQSELIQPIFYK